MTSQGEGTAHTTCKVIFHKFIAGWVDVIAQRARFEDGGIGDRRAGGRVGRRTGGQHDRRTGAPAGGRVGGPAGP